MTENDPLEIIKSDERFLPPKAPRRPIKRKSKNALEHMFEKFFEEEPRHGED